MRAKPSIEIRHLRTFLAVAETENFTRAAERLELSQPGISQQMKELEAELGTLLFQRLGARVRLTQAGHALRERAAVVLSRFAEACRSVEHAPGAAQGHLDVGVIPALDLSWMPPVLARLAHEHPGLSVTLHGKSASEVETEVEAGRLDLGVGLLSHAAPNVRYEKLVGGEMVLVLPAASALARKRSIRLRELASVRLVLFPPSFLIRQMVDQAFREAHLRPRVGFEIDTIDALLATSVRSGLPTLLPSVVLEGREALALRAVALADWTQRFEFGLLWPGGREGAPNAALFAGILRACVGAAGGGRRARGTARRARRR